ncbi:MAG: hypothetical protein FWE62_01715 [Firmicutes bacterium]|nr:hypothetical protein [Bacillota bacterium]
MKKIICSALTAVMLWCAGCTLVGEGGAETLPLYSGDDFAAAETASSAEVNKTLDYLTATDALGRTFLPVVTAPSSKHVGMFYFTWMGQYAGHTSQIYDIEKLIAEFGNNLSNPVWTTQRMGEVLYSPSATPEQGFHFNAEPLYGYYNSADEWVIRKQLELFTLSGIDFLAVDATNNDTYDVVWKKLLEVAADYIAQGWNVPKVIFYTNTNTKTTIEHLYAELYSKNYYPETWYMQGGKPVIIGNNKSNSSRPDGLNLRDLTEPVKSYFTFWDSQWPDDTTTYANGIPWIDWQFPQRVYGSSGKTMSVSVAQHPGHPMSKSAYPGATTTQYNLNYGRGFRHNYTSGTAHTWSGNFNSRSSRCVSAGCGNDPARVNEGSNFQQQWDNANSQKNNIDRILITGWNEWVVQKQYNYHVDAGPNRSGFVDSFGVEFGRDIEMMKGGYGDNYFLQNMTQVRKFKYGASAPAANGVKSVSFNSAAAFDSVTYYDFTGAVNRNFVDAAGTSNYVDNSMRNDIASVSVAHDAEYLYVQVKTDGNISAYSGGDRLWMNVLLGVANSAKRSWEGYNFVLNRYPAAGNKTSLEAFKDGENNTYLIDLVDYYLQGDTINFRVKLASLDIQGAFELNVKAADNVIGQWDIMNYYLRGDSAPVGRLSYHYKGAL